LCISRIHKKEYLPLISSTETNEGCNSTAAWISLAFANSTTTFAECVRERILSRSKLQILIRLLRNHRYIENDTYHPSNNLQLQQQTLPSPSEQQRKTFFVDEICAAKRKGKQRNQCVTVPTGSMLLQEIG
jgi:hypothetical protein